MNANQTEDGKVIDVPMEFGANAYLDYPISNLNWIVFAGFDYENFSTFNTEELETKSLATRQITQGFATLGAAKGFKLIDQSFFLKLSASRTVYADESRASLVDPVPFEGYKYMVYLNAKYDDRLFVHGLFKQHLLEGPTSLVITRIGFGFGYKFF